MRLWDVASQKTIRKFRSHSLSVNCAAFSPDGKSALSASADGSIKLWDIGSGKVLKTFSGHRGMITSAMFTKDGAHALSGSTDKALIL